MTPPTLADRDAARKLVKRFYLTARRYGATPIKAHALAVEHAVKLGAANPHYLADVARLEIDEPTRPGEP